MQNKSLARLKCGFTVKLIKQFRNLTIKILIGVPNALSYVLLTMRL